MVDTENAALEQAEETLGGVDGDAALAFGAGVLARRVRDAVGVAHLAAEPVVDRKLVGAERGVAIEPSEHQRVERYGTGRRDDGRASLAAALDSGEHHRLVGPTTARDGRPVLLPVLGLAADLGFIALDDPGQRHFLAVSNMARSRCNRCQQVRYCT